jgi:hypothetical protein
MEELYQLSDELGLITDTSNITNFLENNEPELGLLEMISMIVKRKISIDAVSYNTILDVIDNYELSESLITKSELNELLINLHDLKVSK